MREVIIVNGGKPLFGKVKPIPNKNAILTLLPASILTSKTVVYKNVPKSPDVLKMIEILKILGAKIKVPKNWREDKGGTININTKTINSYKIDYGTGKKFRASILLAGPLLARFGKVFLPLPGGCSLGARSIATHIDNFKKMGAHIKYKKEGVLIEIKTPPKNVFIWQTETSVTATENLILYLSGIKEKNTIFNAASEPHVTQLEKMLIKMGVSIRGVGSNKLQIQGNKTRNIKGTTVHIDPDFVDITGLIIAASITKGKMTIVNSYKQEIMGGIIQILRKFGVNIKIRDKDIIIDGEKQELNILKHLDELPLAKKGLPKIVAQPWPGFPVDALPALVVLACKSKGEVLIQNWMYETGLHFANILNSMGANIFISDPQRIIVKGPVTFKGEFVTAPGIIQATYALFLAALSTKEKTVIEGAEILKRRYPNIFKLYRKLGAKIQVKKIKNAY